jgi:hypothetical protein
MGGLGEDEIETGCKSVDALLRTMREEEASNLFQKFFV